MNDKPHLVGYDYHDATGLCACGSLVEYSVRFAVGEIPTVVTRCYNCDQIMKEMLESITRTPDTE